MWCLFLFWFFFYDKLWLSCLIKLLSKSSNIICANGDKNKTRSKHSLFVSCWCHKCHICSIGGTQWKGRSLTSIWTLLFPKKPQKRWKRRKPTEHPDLRPPQRHSPCCGRCVSVDSLGFWPSIHVWTWHKSDPIHLRSTKQLQKPDVESCGAETRRTWWGSFIRDGSWSVWCLTNGHTGNSWTNG